MVQYQQVIYTMKTLFISKHQMYVMKQVGLMLTTTLFVVIAKFLLTIWTLFIQLVMPTVLTLEDHALEHGKRLTRHVVSNPLNTAIMTLVHIQLMQFVNVELME